MCQHTALNKPTKLNFMYAELRRKYFLPIDLWGEFEDFKVPAVLWQMG